MSIAFESDWRDAQGNLRAIPHVSTTNLSFLRTCQLLKRMKISNHFFPLALYDPDLANVDVHALEDNTPENEFLRHKVQVEARRNVWYYLRECIRIYEQGGSPIPFRLDRGSCAMVWCFINGLDYTGMQPRQTGKTVTALSLSSWVMYASGEEFQIGMFCKDDKLRQENVKRVKSFGENLPGWWLAEDKFRDKKNTDELFYNAMRTHYVTFVAQKDKSAADLQARGASSPMLHIDEAEFCQNIGITYPTMLASTGTARVNAKKNGKPHSNLITTTAGDPSKAPCKEFTKIVEGAMPFTELLYDTTNYDKLHELVSATSPQKMILGVFSHLQLGYDNDWLREKIQRGRLTKDQVCRDYLNRRVSIQEEPIIPPGTLAAINSSQIDPKYMQIISDRFVLYWYLDKSVVESAAFRDKPIIVGCDSSELIGRDATTLIGVDPTTLETVFSWRMAEGNINRVGVMIAKLLMMYPKMLWVPENKSSGTSLIDIVSMMLRNENHNPFTRIFNWVVQNRHEDEFSRHNIRDTSLADTQIKRYFGIKTDKSKRDQLYSEVLLEGCGKAAKFIRDRTLITELSGLTSRNGRVDHEDGSTDDCVIAWLLAIWLIMYGRNLDIYGIRPGTVMSYVAGSQSDERKLSLERVSAIQARLERAEQDYRMQQDPAMKRFLLSDIEVYKRMLQDAPSHTPQTADDLSRSPSKFIDRHTAEQSRAPVDTDEVERSMRMLLGLR